MYVSIATARVRPDRLDEAVRAWKRVQEAHAQPKGIVRSHCLVERTSNELVVLGFWESEADARAFEDSAHFQEVVAALRPFTEGAPVRRVYDEAARFGGATA